MNELPRQKLIEIIAQYGLAIIDEPRRVEGLLKDLCGECKREINTLMDAARERVPHDLRDANPNLPPEMLVNGLIQRLLGNRPMSEEMARWAVESWATALGVPVQLAPNEAAEEETRHAAAVYAAEQERVEEQRRFDEAYAFLTEKARLEEQRRAAEAYAAQQAQREEERRAAEVYAAEQARLEERRHAAEAYAAEQARREEQRRAAEIHAAQQANQTWPPGGNHSLPAQPATREKISRRQFLWISGGVLGVGLCTLAAYAAKNSLFAAPAAPATAIPPAATQPPMATRPPVVTATSVPTRAITATPAVSAARYQEAPAIANLVRSGNLLPVETRLPRVPLVLAPIGGVGKYGGRLRSYWSGTWLGFFQESQYGHSPLRFIDNGLGVAPGLCDSWQTNASNTEWTFHLREGLKWSSGDPCTIDDVIFWWEDLTQATDAKHPEAVPDFGRDANGKLATFTQVGSYILKISYGTPAPLTAKRLAMWVNANIGPRWIAPKKYLSQFHPKYNPALSDFTKFNQMSETWTNPALPSLNSWVLTKYVEGQSLTAERNPYYYAVDTAGNQLPYIDGLDWVHASDKQTEMLLVRQGLIDHQHFNNFTLGDVQALKDGQDAGNYDIYLWDSGSGTGMMYLWNFDAADARLRSMYRTPQFRQALSLALDRATIQKTVYLGYGTPTTGTMSPKAFEFNYNAAAQAFYQKARDIYVAYDPEKAKALLNQIGCKVGADGKRTYPDGSRFELRIDLTTDANQECWNVLEIARRSWEALGLNVIVNQVAPDKFDEGWRSGKLTFRTNWEVADGPDQLLYPGWLVPNESSRWAPLGGGVLQYAGYPAEADKSPWGRTPPRFNKNDADYKGTPVEKLQQLYAQAMIEPDEIKRAQLVWQMVQIHMDQGPFFIGTVGNTPRPKIVNRKLKGVPKREELKLGGFDLPWNIPYPAVTNPETWSFK